MGSPTGVVWGTLPDLPGIQQWLLKFGGPWYQKRVENATIEVASLILSWMKAIVHVRTGDLEASLAMEIRNRGVSTVAVLGSPLAYASFEEARDSGRRWEELTLDQAAPLKHSFLAKSYMATQDKQAAIWRRWLLVF